MTLLDVKAPLVKTRDGRADSDVALLKQSFLNHVAYTQAKVARLRDEARSVS